MLISWFCAFSQQDIIKKYDDSQNMPIVTQQEAHYPAGESELIRYLNENIVFPDDINDEIISKNILLSFNVMPDSSIKDLTIISGTENESIDFQIMQLFGKLKFAPSVQNGITIKMNLLLSLPIRIKKKTG
jgi:hypothetical protein